MSIVKTVDRAIDILNCFTVEQSELAVSEIAIRLSVHKSVASRLAATLRLRDFLRMDPATRRYRIGKRVFELGQLFDQQGSISEIAMPHLRALVRSVGHASHVGVLEGRDVLIVSCVESDHQLQVAVRVGGKRPAHATASGKLFLAYGKLNVQEIANGNGRLPKVGPRTIETVADMQKELAVIFKTGIAYNREESLRGVGAVAAPILSADDQILASLTTIFPLAVVDLIELKRIGAEVAKAAGKISAQLAAASR